jgi:hypothetical protein
MTLEEELQRIKEMHDKSILIETEVNKKPIDGEKLKKGQEIITSDSESDEDEDKIDETIRCKSGRCKLYSHKGKVLGKGSHAEMEKREAQVNYFKNKNK